jgi:hypothetical protein
MGRQFDFFPKGFVSILADQTSDPSPKVDGGEVVDIIVVNDIAKKFGGSGKMGAKRRHDVQRQHQGPG